jgi:hypothetical protein
MPVFICLGYLYYSLRPTIFILPKIHIVGTEGVPYIHVLPFTSFILLVMLMLVEFPSVLLNFF